MINLVTQQTITKENIEDILITVKEQGYPWFYVPGKTSEVVPGFFAKGHLVVREDVDDDEGYAKSHALTFKTLSEGLQKLYNDRPQHIQDIVEGNWDAETADLVMQYALFGKIVYG